MILSACFFFARYMISGMMTEVGFPYDTSLMFFWEFYSMNMPMFVGSSGAFFGDLPTCCKCPNKNGPGAI